MTSGRDADELIDLVYGALCGEATWQDFLERAREVLPGGQAVLFFHDAKSGSGALPLTAGVDPAMTAAYQAHYSTINPWMPHAAMRPLGRVMQSDEMLPRAELEATEFYHDWLKPQGLATGFGVTIRRDGGCNFLFSVMCGGLDEAEAETARATLQAVVPHLARAFDYYRRRPEAARFGPAHGAEAALAAAHGVVRVGDGLRVLHADEEAQRLVEESGCLTFTATGQLACAFGTLAEFVEAALAGWDGGAAPPVSQVFHLPRQDGALPLRVTAHRPGGDGIALFRGPECLLLLEDPAEGLDAAVAEFAAMHGLSGAERRVVAGLAQGMPVEEIAERTGHSANTVRSQLKQVFVRSGLKRQSEVVRHVGVMAGAARPASAPAAATVRQRRGRRAIPA